MVDELLFCAIIFFAGLVRGISGFALGLLGLSLLTNLIDVHIAIALIALLQPIVTSILLFYYRQSVNFKEVIPIAICSFIAVPFGVIVSDTIDDRLVLSFLGIIIIFYVLYCWFTPRLPEVKASGWGYLAGLASGFFSGAYNSCGPPLIMYANSCQWNPEEFKSNIQGVRICSMIFAVVVHGLNHDLTSQVWHLFIPGILSVCMGVLAGIFVSNYLNPIIFKKVVLVLLLITGIKLFF
jgi:uncharacterized membrane protein YfcA